MIADKLEAFYEQLGPQLKSSGLYEGSLRQNCKDLEDEASQLNRLGISTGHALQEGIGLSSAPCCRPNFSTRISVNGFISGNFYSNSILRGAKRSARTQRAARFCCA